VARLAGVSQSAVSRCFSPGASIAPKTRAKVEAAARQLGYRPDPLARSLITRRSGLVGLVVTTATLRTSPQIVHALSDALAEAGFMPLLTTVALEADLGSDWQRMLQYRPEALVSLATVDAGFLAEAARRRLPIVLVNRVAPRGGAAISIRCDHAAGVDELTSRLIARGRRRLGFLAGPAGAPVSAEREAGFRRALKRANLMPAAMLASDYSYDGGYATTLALLADRDRLDALVCANDAMALGALDAVRVACGLAVPQQLAITGFDDIDEAGRPTRGLTTVRPPIDAMARLTVDALTAAVRGEPAGAVASHLVPGLLVVRDTADL
jgi:DNA-binding LacI/PurR family transcriptional regulator